jgi:glycosyltransferase involved in cell wall biosynthesis
VSRKICLLSDHHLCINPRLWKEAFFYESEGCEVVILTMWQSADLRIRDHNILKGHRIEYKPFLNLIPGEIHEPFRFFYRIRRRLAAELQKWTGIGTEWAISHAPSLMYEKAIREEADLYVAHLECAFYTGRALLKAGKKVGFDFEDWYSRDYLTSDRAITLLERVEAYALKNGLFCTAPSHAMVRALFAEYAPGAPVEVIYNSFPATAYSGVEHGNPKREVDRIIKMVWTSRTVGPGRGLETFITALHQIDHPVSLTVIGQCISGYRDEIEALWPASKGHQLQFIGFIDHNDLMQQLLGFDIGLALEMYYPPNKNTTISNKILQYLQVGIPVLATDTDGQKEVADLMPESVYLLQGDDPRAWVNVISEALQSMNQQDTEAILTKYEKYFSWTMQKKKLKALISGQI